jgi:hypothetical protein
VEIFERGKIIFWSNQIRFTLKFGLNKKCWHCSLARPTCRCHTPRAPVLSPAAEVVSPRGAAPADQSACSSPSLVSFSLTFLFGKLQRRQTLSLPRAATMVGRAQPPPQHLPGRAGAQGCSATHRPPSPSPLVLDAPSALAEPTPVVAGHLPRAVFAVVRLLHRAIHPWALSRCHSSTPTRDP